jgi:hypothetical protein
MNDTTEGTSNTKPLPSSEPSLFESIFGPLDEHEDVKCLENVIQELNGHPNQLESIMDDQTQNEEAGRPVLSKSGLYKKHWRYAVLLLYCQEHQYLILSISVATAEAAVQVHRVARKVSLTYPTILTPWTTN